MSANLILDRDPLFFPFSFFFLNFNFPPKDETRREECFSLSVSAPSFPDQTQNTRSSFDSCYKGKQRIQKSPGADKT